MVAPHGKLLANFTEWMGQQLNMPMVPQCGFSMASCTGTLDQQLSSQMVRDLGGYMGPSTTVSLHTVQQRAWPQQKKQSFC